MYYSPKTSTDGLVFHYDTGNTVRSYLGEPTTNLIDSINFTTDYNTSWNAQESIIQTKNQLNPRGVIDVTAIKIESNSNSDNYFGVRGVKFASSGTNHTFSFWAKGNKVYNDFPINFGANQVRVYVNITTEWKYFTVQTGAGTTFTDHTLHFGGWGTWTDNTFDLFLWRPQLEFKSHATPYTAGTRSATQGLRDLVAKNTIDLTNVSFDSNAQMTFDGTNDTVSIASNSSNNVANNITMELVVNRTAGYSAAVMHKELQYTLYINSNGSITYADSSLWSYSTFGSHGNLTAGTYHHLVAVKAGGDLVTIYLNGNIVVSKNFGGAISQTNNTLYIGSYDGGSNYFAGQIPVAKIYNRALTADEVQRNFNAVKSRFNIA